MSEDRLPEFSLLNDAGDTISNPYLRGTYSFIYFAPDIDSEGPREALSDLNGILSKAEDLRARLVCVCKEDPQTLSQLREELSLGLDLVSDPESEIAAAEDVKLEGRDFYRQCLLVDPWGSVRTVCMIPETEDFADNALMIIEEAVYSDQSLNPAIVSRRAYRAFEEEKIDRESITLILEAGHLAPSCMNKQPWRFIVIDKPEDLKRVHEHLSDGNYWMKRAPVLIAAHATKGDDCTLNDRRNYYLFGTGMAVGFMMVQATRIGMILHPVAGYDPIGLKKLLDIPEEAVLITVMALGYPGDPDTLGEKHKRIELSERTRNPLEQVVRWFSE